MPTLQQLKYLVAIADHLHFRRAAEACHVTQPTLSAQIKTLEERLGVSLIERNRSRVILSPTGRAVAEHARKALSAVDEIRSAAASGASMLESTIRVGMVQSLGSYLLPLIVPDIHEQHPRLGLYLREGLPNSLLRGLADGSLDLLFFPMPVQNAEFQTVSLFREPIHLVIPASHRLTEQETIDPARLRGERILALEPGHKLYDQVRSLAEAYGAELAQEYEGTSLDTLRQMVAMGMGISLMPALYIRSEVRNHDTVVARTLRGGAPSRTIGMIWRKGTAREAEFRMLADIITDTLRRNVPEVSVLG